MFSETDGKWKDYYLEDDDKEINRLLLLRIERQQEQNNNHQSNTRQLRSRRRRVKDKEYYCMLHVRTNANNDEIKQPYRKEALRIHPDKNNKFKVEEANEKFQKLVLAYRVLSNKDTQHDHDIKGKCYIKKLEKKKEVTINPYIFCYYIRIGSS